MSTARIEAALRLAEERFASANDDLRSDRIHSAAASLYFAAFNACLAVLISRGVETSRHSHTQAEFNRVLVKNGLVPADEARTYNKLYELRARADYDLESALDREEVEVYVDVVRRLMDTLSNLAIR